MTLNRYEESVIENAELPLSWKSQSVLDDFEDFLQQNWNQRAVFYDDERTESNQQFLRFLSHGDIRTNNYIGTIAFKGEQINIYPKVFRESSDDTSCDKLRLKHLMNNLIQWIDYCNRVSYPFINISAELKDAKDFRELFISLYVNYVQIALERSAFYEYIDETDDIRSIKGKLDIADYLTRKIPNGQSDRFRCTYSKFEYDNQVNRIIKYTCRQLINYTSDKNQKAIFNILMRLNEVSDVQCSPKDCDLIRLSKMHGNYKIIISLSKMFLLNKTSAFTMDLAESFCFLFPTEYLFEGFVGSYLQEEIENHGGKVYLQKSDMYLIDNIQYDNQSFGESFAMKHDILVEYDNCIYILDTKYKAISRFTGSNKIKSIIANEIKQSDLYQICEYARKQSVKDVFLLYPMFRYEENEPHFPIGISKDRNGEIRIHFVRVPFIFEEDESKTKDQLSRLIKYLFKISEN